MQASPPQEGRGWVQKGDDAVVYHGTVGINTDNPQEALTVHGNALITGTVLKPSDQRIKENIQPVDPSKQLENIQNLRIYDYDLKQWRDNVPPKQKERGGLWSSSSFYTMQF